MAEVFSRLTCLGTSRIGEGGEEPAAVTPGSELRLLLGGREIWGDIIHGMGKKATLSQWLTSRRQSEKFWPKKGTVTVSQKCFGPQKGTVPVRQKRFGPKKVPYQSAGNILAQKRYRTRQKVCWPKKGTVPPIARRR